MQPRIHVLDIDDKLRGDPTAGELDCPRQETSSRIHAIG
jgi:hypothetical protein